jgi:hypothetical protein
MKENVKFVKDELNSEEKFIEGFVKVERIYKKYKALIFALTAIIIIAVIGLSVNSYIKNENKTQANIAFDTLLQNPSDKEALESLKVTNKRLYDVIVYIQAKKDNKDIEINVPYLKELASYQKALKNKNVSELNTLSMQNDFLLKEFAIFNKALILTEQGKYKDAKVALNLIPSSSKVYELASLLKHHLLTK